MEDKRTDSMQRLHSSASAAATSPPSSSSSFIPRPPSPLDLSNFASPFRHFTPSFGPDSFPAAKRPGIPPIPPSPSSSASPPFHSRSLSQPLALDSLPHIAPPPHPPPPLLLDPMLVDDRQPASRTPASRDGLPPRSAHRRSHSDVPFGLPLPSPPAPRRAPFSKQVDCSSPDVVRAGDGCKSEVAAVDDLIIAYMDSLDTLNSSGTEEKHEDLVESSRMSGTRTSGADSENESESSVNESGGDGSCGGERKEGNKRSAVGDLTPLSARHRRSFSMDSFIGKLHFADDSPKFPPSPGNQMGLLSRNGSMDETMSAFSVEFGNGEFNTAEMKKIMADEKLAEMALADPKKVKRILANRLSAARSKERKMRYISELEHKVQILQTEATTLSAQLTMLQRDSIGLTNQNNELKFRLQAMEQQAQLKDAPNFSGEGFSDEAEFTNGSVVYRCAKFQHPFQRLTSEALNEALTAEVQRLKLATGEISEAQISKSMNQQMQLNPQMLQLHQMHSQQQEKKQQTGQTSLYQLPLQKHNNVSAKLESSKC